MFHSKFLGHSIRLGFQRSSRAVYRSSLLLKPAAQFSLFQTHTRSYLSEAIRTHQAQKMAPQLDGYFKQVDSLSDHFIERLRKAVAIPSISADEERRPDVVRMGQFLADELTALGAEVEQRPLGKQPGKEHLDLPPPRRDRSLWKR